MKISEVTTLGRLLSERAALKVKLKKFLCLRNATLFFAGYDCESLSADSDDAIIDAIRGVVVKGVRDEIDRVEAVLREAGVDLDEDSD